MARCRQISDSIKEVFGEAKESGIEVKALKALVKRRVLETQIEALPSEFDEEETAQFEALVDAFGADTPFGQLMASRAARQEPEPWDEPQPARKGRGRAKAAEMAGAA